MSPKLPLITKSRITKPLGFSLIAASVLTWGAVFIIPFLDLEVLQIAGIITGLIIFAEICFFLAILLLGKTYWSRLKQNIMDLINKAKE